MRAFIIFLISFVLYAPSKAQSLVLEKYIEEGINNNLALKQQNLELEKALTSIEIARSNYFPRVNFSPSYSVAFGGRKIDIPIGDLLNPVYNTLNQLTGSNAFPQVENSSEQLAPMNFHDTKLEIKVPIFNTDIKYNVTLQKDLLLTEKAKKKFLEYELRHAITSAYFSYLQTIEVVEIYKNATQTAQQFLALNQKLVHQDVALKDVIYSAEYELSKIQQQELEARQLKKVAAAYFNFLLNKDLETAIVADTSLLSSMPQLPMVKTLKETALNKRPEFEQLNAGLKTQLTLLEMQKKSAALPQIFFGANTGFQGFGYRFNHQAYMVGQLGMIWPIYTAGEKKMKIQQTKISSQILQTKITEVKKQTEMQVSQKYSDVETSLQSLKTKEKDVERTQLLLNLTNSRYKNGTALPIEVTKAQNDLLTAQLTLTTGKLDIWIKFSELKKVSGF